MHNCYKIISFYEFITLYNLEQQKSNLLNFLKKKKCKGTILIANEGINGTISVSADNYKEIIKFIQNLLRREIDFKIQSHSYHAFLRLKVKIKNEIIKLGEKNIFPQKITGNRINPNQWDTLISNKNVVLIDTRNIYESRIGTFKGSIPINSSNFTEFPEWVKKNKKLIKNKKIAMFCTGGVRCEKASSYLINHGFKDVFQLSGGILGYFKKTKNINKNWTGECFVFDERVSLTEKLSKGNYDQCFACRHPINQKDKNSKNYKKGIHCPHCFDQTTSLQKKNFEERNKQIELAKRKGIKHLGS